ncbi:MAG TPA: TIGR02281 family clan AA aspartic protease [Stellaceae bacterium]
MSTAPDWQNDASTASRGEPVFEIDKQGRKVAVAASSGKAMQLAAVMLGAVVVLAVVFGVLMPVPERAPIPAVPKPRPAVARPTPAVTDTPLTYRADASGHFYVTALVNGAPIRFMIDTGASVVTLTPDDARAAGIFMDSLQYTESMSTANGEARAAQTSLRDVRLDQLFVDDVAAVVMENPMPVSLLGMSFLRRLRGYSIKDGVLTIDG